MPQIQYALLKKNIELRFIMLIEISSRAYTTVDDLSFCTDRIVHPRVEMYVMLKYLKSPLIFKDEYRDQILETCWDIMEKRTNKHISKEDYYKLSINITINSKIKNNINERKKIWTRLDYKSYEHTKNKLHIKRSKRWEKLINGTFDLKSELTFSINEYIHEING